MDMGSKWRLNLNELKLMSTKLVQRVNRFFFTVLKFSLIHETRFLQQFPVCCLCRRAVSPPSPSLLQTRHAREFEERLNKPPKRAHCQVRTAKFPRTPLTSAESFPFAYRLVCKLDSQVLAVKKT